MKKINKRFKLIILGVLAVVLLVAIFFVVDSLFFEKRIENSNKVNIFGIQNEEDNEELFVVSGEFVCLPVKDKDRPHNDLCVFGLRNSDGYYRLQLLDNSDLDIINKLENGQRIEVKGKFVNELSDVYKTLGTISVEEVRILKLDLGDKNIVLPSSFNADYISFQDYSLEIFEVADYGKIDCEETNPLLSSLSSQVSKKEIAGQEYCISASSESATGFVYTEYKYTTLMGDNVYLIKFIARYANCSNYSEEDRIKCEKERENFNLDILVEQEVRKNIK